MALDAETDMIDMLLGLCSGEDFLLGFHTATLSLCPQVAFVEHTENASISSFPIGHLPHGNRDSTACYCFILLP